MSRGVEGREVGKGLGSPGPHLDSTVVDGGDGVGFTVKSEHLGGLSEGGEGSGDMAHSSSFRMMGGAEGRAARLSSDVAQGGGGMIDHLEGNARGRQNTLIWRSPGGEITGDGDAPRRRGSELTKCRGKILEAAARGALESGGAGTDGGGLIWSLYHQRAARKKEGGTANLGGRASARGKR